MTTLHATPYNIDATGFYFSTFEEYETKSELHFDRYGNAVEEFEIQFIDGDDAELFRVCEINQCNIKLWFDEIECLEQLQKVSLFYLVSALGYCLDDAMRKLDEPSIQEGELIHAASYLFDECYLSNIPVSVQHYIDYEKFARDCGLSGDMSQFNYTGKTYTCTNANVL